MAATSIARPADYPLYRRRRRGRPRQCVALRSRRVDLVERSRGGGCGGEPDRKRHRLDQPALRARSRRALPRAQAIRRSEEHTSELQSLMRISYAVFCLKNKQESLIPTKQNIHFYD